MHPTLCSQVRKVFRVHLYKNNVGTPLSCILNILNSDWLQHPHGICGVYECKNKPTKYTIIKCVITVSRAEFLQGHSPRGGGAIVFKGGYDSRTRKHLKRVIFLLFLFVFFFNSRCTCVH